MRAWTATIIGGAAALAAAGAAGQAAPPRAAAPPAPATSGVIGFGTSNVPIDATSDSMEVFREQHLTVLKGNVEVIQGETRIRSPELRLYSAARAGAPAQGAAAGIAAGADFGEIERMEAAGPVYYVTPTQQAKGDHATYEKASDTITLTGNVIVTQDKNVIAGDKLVIEQKTGHSTLISNTQGLNKPKRVRGVFYPSQAQPAPGAPAAGPPPPAGAPAPGKAPARKPAPAAPARRR